MGVFAVADKIDLVHDWIEEYLPEIVGGIRRTEKPHHAQA